MCQVRESARGCCRHRYRISLPSKTPAHHPSKFQRCRRCQSPVKSQAGGQFLLTALPKLGGFESPRTALASTCGCRVRRRNQFKDVSCVWPSYWARSHPTHASGSLPLAPAHSVLSLQELTLGEHIFSFQIIAHAQQLEILKRHYPGGMQAGTVTL